MCRYLLNFKTYTKIIPFVLSLGLCLFPYPSAANVPSPKQARILENNYFATGCKVSYLSQFPCPDASGLQGIYACHYADATGINQAGFGLSVNATPNYLQTSGTLLLLAKNLFLTTFNPLKQLYLPYPLARLLMDAYDLYTGNPKDTTQTVNPAVYGALVALTTVALAGPDGSGISPVEHLYDTVPYLLQNPQALQSLLNSLSQIQNGSEIAAVIQSAIAICSDPNAPSTYGETLIKLVC